MDTFDDTTAYDRLLDELDDGNHKYSLFRTYVESLKPEPRILVQMKCIEKFKWEISEEAGREIDWTEATLRWVEDGYAKAFAKAYDEKLPCCCDTYRRTLELQGRLRSKTT